MYELVVDGAIQLNLLCRLTRVVRRRVHAASTCCRHCRLRCVIPILCAIWWRHRRCTFTTARAERADEAFAPIFRHERINDWINAAVEVRHDVERLTHRLQVAVVQFVDVTEGDEDVVDERWSPADGEQHDDCDQYLNHLATKNTSAVSFILNETIFLCCSQLHTDAGKAEI